MTPIFLTIVQSDMGFDWNFTLQDSQGVAQNIANANLFFKAQLISDLAINFKNAMTVISAPAGTCKYTVQEDDFIVPGTYSAQIVVEYNSGEIVTFSDITVEVQPSLPVT